MGQKKLGIDDKNLIRAMTAMGGGIASQGGPCGALNGGVALLGSVFGRDVPEEKDSRVMWKACREFYSRFEKEATGEARSVNCRDITGVDWDQKDEARAFYKGEGIVQCRNNTGKAARILGEVLEKYMKVSGLNS